jgi:poly(A) polymerase
MQRTEEIRSNPLRILEIATAISTGAGVVPGEDVSELCRDNVSALADVPVDPVRDELQRCLLGRDVEVALQWLLDVSVLAKFLPEVAATVDLAQEAGRKHKDVWEHTKLVVKQSVRRPAVRWAALLHDIGKVPTRTFTKQGVHFHGHAEVGARMFDSVSRRMPFEHAMRRKIRFLIKYHLRSAQYSPEWTDSAVRRFAREMDEHLVDLLDLSRADITSRRPGRRQSLLKQISKLSARIDAIRAADAQQPPLPTGLGTAIMTHFDLPPSRLIGDIKDALEQAVEQGELDERREDDYYIGWLESSGLIERLRTEQAERARKRAERPDKKRRSAAE